MGDLNKKIKDSKSVIEQSGLNNPNELYNKAFFVSMHDKFIKTFSQILQYLKCQNQIFNFPN